MNELLLISRARGGDREAFGELVEQYRDNVYRLAYRMCGNAYDADEAAQEAFVAAWRALPNFRGDAKFSTFEEMAQRAGQGFEKLVYEKSYSVFAGSTAPVTA